MSISRKLYFVIEDVFNAYAIYTGDNRMVVTEVTTLPKWRTQKQARSIFLIFSVQTYVHEKFLSCPLDKHAFNDPL